MSRAARPDDLYALRTPMEVRISPDGERIAFVVKEPSPGKDSYRQSIWLVAADGATPARRLTLGVRNDASPRWSPDGHTLAFLSDRAAVLKAGGAADRPDDPDEAAIPAADRARGAVQVWLLPLDGGEAQQLTRLPEDVSDLAWGPDGTQLCVVSAATAAEAHYRRRAPGAPPRRDSRLIDQLQYMHNGVGFTYDRRPNLWIVDVANGAVRQLTRGQSADGAPAWSPDGKRICFVSNRHPDADIIDRQDLYLVGTAGGAVTRVSGGRGERIFAHPSWSPDGAVIGAVGHRFPVGAASANHAWEFAPEAEQAGRDLMPDSPLMIGAALNSDVFGYASSGLAWSADGTWLVVAAPIDGAYELWRVRRADGRVERLTKGDHAVTRPDAVALRGGMRIAAVRNSGTATPDVVALDVAAPRAREVEPASSRQLTQLMAPAWAAVHLVEPVSRWHEVDGRRIQGWFLEAPRRDGKPAPLVVQVHGGPATLYGWSLMWEWQSLVAAGISIYAPNPRGSEGYGQDFCRANFADWGDGPMRDVMAGVDSLIADGLVDPERLGVTGGSYGGYLTAWIIGHTDRFNAAVSCRGVYDLTSEMLSGDIAGPLFGSNEYGVNPWEDPELYRRHSPITYARDMRTPLLIQHAEKDLRCPITQAEELFTVLRSLKRPVRLMRVPDESHELTRSGAPFRRVENIERIRDWFVHYLVEGKTGAAAGVSLRTQVGAAVDVGSNSVHLLVALVGDDRAEPLHDESLQLGLGAIVDREGSLPADAREAALAAIGGYVEVARTMGAERITLLATEPLRRASNAAVLQDEVEHTTGLPLHILEHVTEAELTLLGVQHGHPATAAMLVLDIGGGSTELILAGPDAEPVVGAMPTGSSRLSAAIVRHDPPTWLEIEALRAETARLFAGMPDGRPERGVAVGGSGTNLTKLLELDRLAPLDPGLLEQAVQLLVAQPAADFVASRLINLRRALQLAAGAALLEACMRRYGLSGMEVSDASLREGAALAAAMAGDAWPQRLAFLVRP